NTTVNLGGMFSQADMGTFNRSGGTVNVTGTITGDITLDASTGPWNVQNNGVLANGTITQNNGVVFGFAATNVFLYQETINGDFAPTLNAGGNVVIVAGSLVVTGTLYLGNPSGTTSTQIVAGTGEQQFPIGSLLRN